VQGTYKYNKEIWLSCPPPPPQQKKMLLKVDNKLQRVFFVSQFIYYLFNDIRLSNLPCATSYLRSKSLFPFGPYQREIENHYSISNHILPYQKRYVDNKTTGHESKHRPLHFDSIRYLKVKYQQGRQPIRYNIIIISGPHLNCGRYANCSNSLS